jgi:hypothetical protein
MIVLYDLHLLFLLRVPTLKIEASKISLVFASTNDSDAIPKYIIIEEINNM